MTHSRLCRPAAGRARRFALSALLAVSACSLENEPAPDASADIINAADVATDGASVAADAVPLSDQPTAEMGGSSDEGKGFVDWKSDEEKPPLIHGIQGGEHVYFSVRVRNMDPKKMNLLLHMTDMQTGLAVFPGPLKKFKQTLKKETVDGKWTGWYFKNGFIAFVHCPCLVSGKKVKFELVVTTQDGKVTVKTSHVILPGTAKVKPHWDGDCNADEHDECAKK